MPSFFALNTVFVAYVIAKVESNDVKIQVFASLEAERQKLSEEIERMQQRRAETGKFKSRTCPLNNGFTTGRIFTIVADCLRPTQQSLAVEWESNWNRKAICF